MGLSNILGFHAGHSMYIHINRHVIYFKVEDNIFSNSPILTTITGLIMMPTAVAPIELLHSTFGNSNRPLANVRIHPRANTENTK